eukprot:TRINITY_DN995_c0_g1_i1.p1 TRINITY_DN995_c0_g1~~TRINITY_DN995_c0_g1_i1.p1  ORF type:complete len:310 (-),score=57.94 TRINITY_DN995_c0_g1_i1:98-1027(-)
MASTFVHVKLSDGKQVDLTYHTTDVPLSAIKQIVSQQVGYYVLSASWYYGPRLVSDMETLTSLGVRHGSHCDLFVQSAPTLPAAGHPNTAYSVPKQPIPSYPGMPQPNFVVGAPTFYPAPPQTTVVMPQYPAYSAPVVVQPPTYVQPVIVGGGGGGRMGRGGRIKKPWPNQPRPNEYQLIENKKNGLVLDLENGSCTPGARIILNCAHGGPNQRWVLDSEGFIRSQLNGMVLDIAHGHKHAGAAVVAYPQKHTDNLNQKWIVKRGFIVSRYNGLVLSLSGNHGQGSALIVDHKLKRGVGKKAHQRWYFK